MDIASFVSNYRGPLVALLGFSIAVTVITVAIVSRPPSPLNSGFVGNEEIPTHLTCRSISSGQIIIDRNEPFGTLFHKADNSVLLKELTPDRKRRWTLLTQDVVCEEIEQ